MSWSSGPFVLGGLLSCLLAFVACRPQEPVAVVTSVPAVQHSQVTADAATALLPATALPPTNTSQPTMTALPSATPTPTPSATPLPAATAAPTLTLFPTLDGALPTPPTAIPTPVPPLAQPPDTVNILLLGNDVEWAQGGRTDSMIIVSLNKATKTANLLSIPRDLYVYIPGWTMTRINLALPHGHGAGYPGGGGGLVKDTILYNFGIPIDYYVRLGFRGFTQAVDVMGGVEVVVNCPLRDWRLISPELDATVEENWEMFLLEPGVHWMNGELALWYVRSRRTTNDFERGRRQQQLLRAMLNKGVNRDLLSQAPPLWNAYQDYVETDISLPLMLELGALAPAVRDNSIQHLYLAGEAVRAWQVPTSKESVQLLQWEPAHEVLAQLMQPPALNRATRPPVTVEVVTDNVILYRQAAENLAWYGFVPVRGHTTEPMPARTQVTYYGANFKGAFSDLLGWLFQRREADMNLVTDAANQYSYRVILGADFNPCLPQLDAPLNGAGNTADEG